MKKTAEQKRLEYEAMKALESAEPRVLTPINTIEFPYTLGLNTITKSFSSSEELSDFLQCQNPMKISEIKDKTIGVLDINGLGVGLTFVIL